MGKVSEEISMLEIMRYLRSPLGQEFFERIIKKRMADAQLDVMKPANSQDQLLAGERSKGAYLAFASLTPLFDVNVPLPTTEKSDED